MRRERIWAFPPSSRAPRVSLAPKTPFAFPFKRLSRRLLSNLVLGFSLLPLSLSRSVGMGRREPWERGWLLRRQFEVKPEVALQNVDCFLRLLFTQYQLFEHQEWVHPHKTTKTTGCTGDYLHVERPEKNYSIGITGRHTWTSFI